MRIAIDLQAAQGQNQHRGIGRYSLGLVQGIARNRGEHEVLVVLSDLFPEANADIRAAFRGLLPADAIRVWTAPGPTAAIAPANDFRRKDAELIREAFIASLEPDAVLVCSLFEGLGDDVVTSVAGLSGPPVATVLYDLIPLLRPETYLKSGPYTAWYMEKINHMRRADHLLAISASAAGEAVSALDWDPARVANISTAADPMFRPLGLPRAELDRVAQGYGIKRDFVMYTGGIDHRKNIEGLIQAYALLPEILRQTCQLAIVCRVSAEERLYLNGVVANAGLSPDEVILTDFVPDEDLVALYNACKAFVFPSLHEGFGLPALEAMQCGRAVIASNTSSLPEVIGREDALFDPSDVKAIAALIQRVLTDDDYREKLQVHGLARSQLFSWDITAERAIATLETMVSEKEKGRIPAGISSKKLRLAFVSPLPPEKSGIADYSAEILPYLAEHYDIEVVVHQGSVADQWVARHLPVRDVNWFRTNYKGYDRVLYQFGNSEYHAHMPSLLEEAPGVVVLHDFFLSGLQTYLGEKNWIHALTHSHGLPALIKDLRSDDRRDLVWGYPANLEILQQSLGTIVHSQFSKDSLRTFYGGGQTESWAIIPHARRAAEFGSEQGNSGSGDFLICSFGHVVETKLGESLLRAFHKSARCEEIGAKLIFAGSSDSSYADELRQLSASLGLSDRVSFSGWIDQQTYHHYLRSAEIAVQLRSRSRGETSGAVLDCMNYGVATIVNANGSMAELPDDGVLKIPDNFSNEQLTDALDSLVADASRRDGLGARAREIILEQHDPAICAQRYRDAIEAAYASSKATGLLLPDSLSLQDGDRTRTLSLARSLACNIIPSPRERQILVDVSKLWIQDIGTGIQRVVRSILSELLSSKVAGWRVEPIYCVEAGQPFRYARSFAARVSGVEADLSMDDPVDAWLGDIFLGLDLSPDCPRSGLDEIEGWQRRGVRTCLVVYDLLPVLKPEYFDKQTEDVFTDWLHRVVRSDQAICISNAVASELKDWARKNAPSRADSVQIGYFHLGADIEGSKPSVGIPRGASDVLKVIAARPSFLMVGTLEPRKGHRQVLAAFEELWSRNVDVNLVLVGRQGWNTKELADRLNAHAERGNRLFWLNDASDEYLEKVYEASTCLIAASEGEGFGLPLIEAAQHGLPILARDLTVFQEVAQDHATYFSGHSGSDLAAAIERWLGDWRDGRHRKSDGMPWLTWRQSAEALLRAIGAGEAIGCGATSASSDHVGS